MGALTGTAAGLCAGTRLFHLPPLGQRRLVHRLQAETFPLTFVKCLGQKKKGIGERVIKLSLNYSFFKGCTDPALSLLVLIQIPRLRLSAVIEH